MAFARIFSNDPERDIVRRTARGLLVVGILVVVIVGFIVLDGGRVGVRGDVSRHDPVLPTAITALIGSIPFLVIVLDGAGAGRLSDAAAARAELAVGGRPGGRRRDWPWSS